MKITIGNQWPIGKHLRFRSNEVLWSREVHQRMRKWVLRCPWHEKIHAQLTELTDESIKDSTNQWTSASILELSSESMNQRNNDSVNQWSSDPLNQGINESKSEWFNVSMSQCIINGSMFQWVDASMNHRIIESMNQWISESTNQRTNEWMVQRFSESMSQWISESMKQWINKSLVQRVSEWQSQWINESVNQWINEWVSEGVNEWMNERMNEWTNEPSNQETKERMNQWILPTSSSKSVPIPLSFLRFEMQITGWCTFCQPQLPQLFQYPQFFCDIEMQHKIIEMSSSYILVHILPTSSSKSVPVSSILLQFWNAKQIHWNANRTLATFLCTFCQPHLPKVFRSLQFFTIFMWNRAFVTFSCTSCRPHLRKELRTWQFFLNILKRKSRSRCNPAHFCQQLLQIEAEPAETETLLRRPRKPLYPKKHTVSGPRVFSPVNSHASELLHVPTTWWWVVDMVMWLTWWCGWHGGGHADHDNRP